MHMRTLRPLLIAALLLSVSACTTVVNPVTGRTELSVMDEATEIQEGAKAHEGVLQEYGVYSDARLQAYVNELGQRLAKQSHRANLKWTFTVLDSPEINAFALPGGYVYVTRGIMAYLDSEAELAGVIGHEIGHVTARHGAQRATRQQTAGIGVMAATLLGAVLEGVTGIGGAANIASQVSQTAAAGYIASYSRDQETQADELGAEYLSRNRYNPQNMVDVIQVLKNQEQFAADVAKTEGKVASASDWLSSHPANDKRLADIKLFAAKYKSQEGYADDGRARYLQAISGMTFGDSPEQGLVRGRNFYHESLDIALTAPQGWQIQNAPEAIALVNGAGDAGLIVRPVPPKAGKTHEEVIRNVLKPVDGRTERRTLHGLAATHFAGTVRNQQGQTAPATLTLVTGPGDRIYWMQYAAKNADARQRAMAGLREAESSFRPLTAADRAAAKPWSVQTVPYPAGGFSELVKSSPLPPARAEAQLRLMNGMYGGGPEPKPGQAVKIVK